MGRPSNTETRRDQIVIGLMKAMAKHGYSGASIQMIAKEAKLTSGLIHYHFKSKVEILVALLEHLMAVAEKRTEHAPQSKSATERLNSLVDAFLLRGKGESPTAVAAWVCIGAEAVQQKEVRAAYSTAIKNRLDQLTVAVAAALRENNKSPEEAPIIAAGILALAEGAFHLFCSAPGVLPDDYAAQMAKRLIAASVS